MVPLSLASPTISTLDSGSDSRPFVPSDRTDSPRPSQPQTDCSVSPLPLMARQPILYFPVHSILLSSHKLSTRKLYKSKWKRFVKWVEQNHIEPFTAPTYTVLEFLAGLSIEGANASTIRVQLATISNFHVGLHSSSLFPLLLDLPLKTLFPHGI